MIKRNLLVSLTTLSLLPITSEALDIGVTVDVESEFTTNTALTETNELEEWIHKPGINFSASHEAPNLTLEADYSFEHRFYQEDLFEDESATTGRADILWNAIPERLDFTVRNTRTETPIEAIDAATPSNRQETSNTEAGPTLRFHTRGDDEFQLEYLFGARSSDLTNTDSTSGLAVARYNLVMSPTNSLSFEGLNNDVDFDDPLAPDIDATIGQISWIRTSNSVEFTLMGGYNQTERTLGREDVDGSIYNLNVVWQARPATSITFLVAHDIRAQPEALSTGTTEFGDRLTGTTSDSNELFTNDRQEISIEQQLGRNTITLGLFNNEEDYEDVLQDNENRGVRLQLDRELSPRSRLAFALESRKHDFTDEGEEIEEIRASLLVEWDLSRRLGMAIGATYQDRESDAEVGFRPSYDEWAGTISFVYDLFD